MVTLKENISLDEIFSEIGFDKFFEGLRFVDLVHELCSHIYIYVHLPCLLVTWAPTLMATRQLLPTPLLSGRLQ